MEHPKVAERKYAGFTASIYRAEAGFEVFYRDNLEEELDRETFTGISDYQVKTEHIDSRLKHLWEQR